MVDMQTRPIGDANVPRDYTCHVWLDEHNLLVGSERIRFSDQGCDVIQHQVFENSRWGCLMINWSGSHCK